MKLGQLIQMLYAPMTKISLRYEKQKVEEVFQIGKHTWNPEISFCVMPTNIWF